MLLCFNISAQGGNLSSSSDQVELPSIIPPSPTAFQMTQYGDVTVNESTGKISPSIPLYTYKAGKLSLPISLSYQGNGVKLDQAASWTGINWNLLASGLITRTVRGKDDLMLPSGRKFYSQEDIYAMDFKNNPNHVSEIDNFIKNSNIDSEVDIFSFSFPGGSGSFYLDEELEPRLTNYDKELKIELNPILPTLDGITQHLKRNITITTPDGVKYYFGGLEASESSKIEYSPLVPGSQIQFAQTAFYLTKIVHPFGDEIYFEYDIPKDYRILTSVSEIDTRKMSIAPYEVKGCGEINLGSLSSSKRNYIFNNIADGQFLKRISSNRNNYEIVFNTSNANSTLRKHYIKVLNSFTVRKTNNVSEELERINFTYLYPRGRQTSQRFFLSGIKFLDSRRYSMVYNNPKDLPERLSFSRDNLGYYNGKDNNTLLPKNEHGMYAAINHTLADRSASFNYSSKGSLTKLIYPTKGYTTFTYESGFLNKKATKTKRKAFLVYRNNPSRNLTTLNPNSVKIGQSSITEKGKVEQETIIDQTIDVRLYNIKSSEDLDFHVKFILSVKDLTKGLTKEYEKWYQIDQGTPTNDHYLGNVKKYPTYLFKKIKLLQNHTYKISLKIQANSYQSDAIIVANLDFNYDIESNSLQEDLGIRVKEVTNHKEDHTGHYVVANKKTYKYTNATESIVPRYLYGSSIVICCEGENGGMAHSQIGMINLRSSSINSLYTNANNEKLYRTVKVSSSSALKDNGYVEKEYLILGDAAPLNLLEEYFRSSGLDNYNLPSSRENTSAVNGRLLKETVFSKNADTNNTYKPVQQTRNYYNITRENIVHNNVRSVLIKSCYRYSDQKQLDGLYLGMYNTYSNKVALDSTITRFYDYNNIKDPATLDTDGDGIIDSIDNDDDNDGYVDFIDGDDDGDGIADEDEGKEQPNIIKKITRYQYNQYVGIPTEITVNDSQDITLKTKQYYVDGYITEDPQAMYRTKLFGKFIINNPYKKERFKNNILLSTQKINYRHWDNNIVLPETIQTSKGTAPLEDRIVYHKYDDKGNSVEISKKDGTKIYYVWGYHKTQPIAKIEGYTDAQITAVQTKIKTAVTASNSDTSRCLDSDNCNEKVLRDKLTLLRNSFTSTNTQVTTSTYDPLIGVTSMTDPKGYTIYYEYDEFNRLKQVKDADGNILSNNQYNYKN